MDLTLRSSEVRKRKAEYAKKWQQANKDKMKDNAKRTRRRLRLRVLEHLGGKCIRCGITDTRVLQIDHVNGGGSKERIVFTHRDEFHRKVLKDDANCYQLLCANCNWIKRHENQEFDAD